MKRREFLKNSAVLGTAMALGSTNLFADENSKQGAKMQTITLNTGAKMPIIGFGVWQLDDLKICQKATEEALEVGYRHIDTAQAYFNEEAVGAAIKNSGIARDELFITTKLWISHANEKDAMIAFDKSMKKLGLDYLDLYLIHQPYSDTYGAWRAMSKLHKEGRIKSIGISNFVSDRVVDFCLNNEIIPAVNQIGINPFHAQFDAQKINDEYKIVTQAWSPFGNGNANIFANETLKQIAGTHGKSVAQVILRWLVQRNICTFPKTTKKSHMIENLAIFDFSLSDDEMQKIATLDGKGGAFHNPASPDSAKRLIGWKAEF